MLAHSLLRLLWREYMFNGNKHSLRLVAKHWFIQKVFRINSHVPWPVHPTSTVLMPEKIERGTRTPGLSVCCHIDGRNGIKLGNNVWIGPRVSIVSMSHDTSDYHKYLIDSPITIGDNCWLATNCVILPGVELASHTVVAAGAVVTKSFLQGNCILAGVPARIVKSLSEYDSGDLICDIGL
jgi:acetyltransferase-like isoleucine patch superfamily enzyme